MANKGVLSKPLKKRKKLLIIKKILNRDGIGKTNYIILIF